MQRVNKITQILSETVIVPGTAEPSTLASLLASTQGRICQSVFIYSPLNDGIYTDNTLPLLWGFSLIAAATGQPLLPGQFAYIEIDDTQKIYILDPAESGTQLLVVTVSS